LGACYNETIKKVTGASEGQAREGKITGWGTKLCVVIVRRLQMRLGENLVQD